MDDLIKNYKTINMQADADQVDWCIAPVLGKTCQVALKLNNGKKFNYACRYPVKEGAVAIVGREFPYDRVAVTQTANTGAMGSVTEILPKLTIDKRHAVEIDYVFIPNPQKQDLEQCGVFLTSGSKDYLKTLLLGGDCQPVRPITYHIQKILTAASVLAHSDMVDKGMVELAKETISEEKTIDPKMLTVLGDGDCRLTIDEIHIPDSDVEDFWDEIDEEAGDAIRLWDDDILLEGRSNIKEFAASEAVSDYVNKYSHLGAISIMVRGGFINLLEAYLSANPPIEEFLETALELLKKIGNTKAYNLIRDYQ